MKTIMISDEAYRKLAKIKNGKSFTELLSELADNLKQSNKSRLMEFAGIIDDKEAEELQRIAEKVRKRAKARVAM
ncbi:MAG: antitoxin VapB family protein [Candidatus Marsarchaeota archaeon]|jgi:predicted CopG family antitoxin|nr:antitoxin VapB family protein [Candidatus Marsarchaeota archaeon]MCL5111518.1 antitoxin VapB family protein [Candidatus Marsarchaeota archaeon]